MDTLSALLSSLLSSKLVIQSPYFSSSSLLLRRYLLFLLHILLSLFSLLLSLLLAPSRSDSSPKPAAQPEGTRAARALSHVLAVVARVPVASRKYELVRSLAERILDDNLRFGVAGVNRGALSEAFGRTLRRLEAAVAGESGVEALVGKVSRWWWSATAGEEERKGGGAAAEKMAAELMWLGKKMAECGAVEEAVERWSAAAGLGCRAVAAEPRIQVALVRVAVFLFKHANSKQFEGCQGGGQEEEEDKRANCDCWMAMLTSWLPLLCRASNGTDAPVLSGREKAEMVRVLEEMIEKLTWEQQEEVLALWLHNFTLCPDSDWPNLESCYTRWYSESRKLLM
ncbi:uncharacterized protein [Typha angustifolia]|uniref:uncharacterized protein n=1 Tax=Typha angustifolia TaxID=59011 RepID=UPI003C301003